MQPSSAHLRWQALNKRLELAGLLSGNRYRAPLTSTIGQVVILGRYQLELAVFSGDIPQGAALDKMLQKIANAALTAKPHANPDFLAAWHDAMCKEMGAEEVQKFLLTWSPPHHEITT